MAIFRTLSPADLQDILVAFGLSDSDYRGHQPIAAGTINTNIRVDTTHGPRFVRVNEGKTEDDVAREAAVLTHLATAGLPTPKPARVPEGTSYLPWRGTFVSLFPWVDGRVLARAELTPAAVTQVGRQLANLHRLGASFPDRRPGRYEPDEIDRRVTHIELVSARANERDPALEDALDKLRPELASLAPQRSAPVPMGLIHGDLFVDNVLFSWNHPELVALLDFEQASWGRLAYDLAVTLLAFCYGRDDFEMELARALVAGYETIRPLEDRERAVWGAELRFAACRFAVTRITDVYLKRGQGAPTGKDFRRYVDRLSRVKARLASDPLVFLGAPH